MNDHYILRGKEVVKVDLMEWATTLETMDRQVARDTLPGDVQVSTVFLGLDHSFGNGPPLLFETMVFGGDHDQEQERYTTWEEAEDGHKRIMQRVG